MVGGGRSGIKEGTSGACWLPRKEGEREFMALIDKDCGGTLAELGEGGIGG